MKDILGKIGEDLMSRNFFKRKSQIEMFGLSLIVILIVVGFLLFVSFRQKIPVNDYKKNYIADEMASNFVNSVVSVTPIECYETDLNILELLKLCARREQISCSGYSNPCELANKTLNIIANRSLVKQELNFVMYTEGLNENLLIKNGVCKNNAGQLGTVIISLYPVMTNNVFLKLQICK